MIIQKRLHITNGSSLTNNLQELNIDGDFLTWYEMLCEGPTIFQIDSDQFFKNRSTFLNTEYKIDIDAYNFKDELSKLNNIDNYTEIVLWFEYDLFCHINLIAAISLLRQKHIELPVFLVCSGRVANSTELKGLSELSQDQLLQHYNDKILLTQKDLELAETLWGIYCGKDHNLLKPFIVTSSSFTYLSNCLKAHLERFPDSKNGLGILEYNILEIINNNTIKSKHHLLGYALNYQGFYGFGDMQLERMIHNLSLFLSINKAGITLNDKGHIALLNKQNYAKEINNNIAFGGVNRLDFQFDKALNKLIKRLTNVH